MKSIRTQFEKDFGKEEAQKLEAAAIKHENGLHPNHGKDPFKWVLMLVISYECITKYREDHNIKTSARKLEKWIKDNGHLESYDGDVDWLALAAGAYDKYMPKKKNEKR